MKLKSKPVVLVALLALVLAALVWFRPWSSPVAHDDVLYGNVDIRSVQLGFRTGGRLASMAAIEGDTVHPGQALATLDSQPAREVLAIADAELAGKEAQLASIQAGARPQEIEQARAGVRDAQVAFEEAQRGAERQQTLLQSQSTSRTQADTAKALRDSTEARLASAQEALALAMAGARQEDIRVAEAAVVAATARREQAQTTVDDHVLLAPSTGIIQTRAREPGSMLGAGQTVYILALTDRVYVRAYIDEPRLAAVVPGSPVSIETDSGGLYSGQIGFVSPTAEFTPKTVQAPELRTDLVYRLRIEVTDADQGLRQGMPVTIKLQDTARPQ